MNLIQKEIKNLLKEVAVEQDLPYRVIEDVYMAQFCYVADEIKKGEKGNPETFSNVLLRHLGTFQISMGKMKYWINKAKKDDEKFITSI